MKTTVGQLRALVKEVALQEIDLNALRDRVLSGETSPGGDEPKLGMTGGGVPVAELTPEEQELIGKALAPFKAKQKSNKEFLDKLRAALRAQGMLDDSGPI